MSPEGTNPKSIPLSIVMAKTAPPCTHRQNTKKANKKNATVKQFLLALIANPKVYTLQKQGFESILNLYQVLSSLS